MNVQIEDRAETRDQGDATGFRGGAGYEAGSGLTAEQSPSRTGRPYHRRSRADNGAGMLRSFVIQDISIEITQLLMEKYKVYLVDIKLDPEFSYSTHILR